MRDFTADLTVTFIPAEVMAKFESDFDFLLRIVLYLPTHNTHNVRTFMLPAIPDPN
jgi:hypothetical protein